MLSFIIDTNIDILLYFRDWMNDTFPPTQFRLKWFCISQRLDKNSKDFWYTFMKIFDQHFEIVAQKARLRP